MWSPGLVMASFRFIGSRHTLVFMVPPALLDCETTRELIHDVSMCTGTVTPLASILSISSLTASSWCTGTDLGNVLLGGISFYNIDVKVFPWELAMAIK